LTIIPVIVTIFISVFVLTPMVGIGWLMYGNKYEWIEIWLRPPNFFITLPYKILKIETTDDL